MSTTVNASVHLNDEARLRADLLTTSKSADGEPSRFVITVRSGEFCLFLTSQRQVREFMDAARAVEVIAASLAMAEAETPGTDETP